MTDRHDSTKHPFVLLAKWMVNHFPIQWPVFISIAGMLLTTVSDLASHRPIPSLGTWLQLGCMFLTYGLYLYVASVRRRLATGSSDDGELFIPHRRFPANFATLGRRAMQPRVERLFRACGQDLPGPWEYEDIGEWRAWNAFLDCTPDEFEVDVSKIGGVLGGALVPGRQVNINVSGGDPLDPTTEYVPGIVVAVTSPTTYVAIRAEKA